MLTIVRDKVRKEKCVPNILPCRINQNGPVLVSRRYWSPTKTHGSRIPIMNMTIVANYILQMGNLLPTFAAENYMEKKSFCQKDIEGL